MKTRKTFWYRLEKTTFLKFKEHIDSLGYDRSKLMAKILKDYLKNNEK